MKPGGLEATVLLLALRRDVELCLSQAVVAEYQTVLRRPELKLNPHEVATTLANIRTVGRLVYPTRTLTISTHESDNRFYECAHTAEADYLVTGNTKHFPVGHGRTTIITARQLIQVLARQSNN